MGNLLQRSNKSGPTFRKVVPNFTVDMPVTHNQHPNKSYKSNKIKTNKYSPLTFLPKNLFEQFHRFANLYFIFVVALNWVPQVQAFGKEIAMIPVVFVLAVTAVKDGFEDFRRYRSDKKINYATCRTYAKDAGFKPTIWKRVHPGDIIHLSCNEIIPADILLLHSSDPLGICNVETSNLDGESNLKQRQIVTGIDYGEGGYKSEKFVYNVECEQPNAEIYKFRGYIKTGDTEQERIPLSQNNVLLRGCIMRNTDYIEGIVVYAGHETKAMLNNRNPRYKRSKLERAINRDVIWCVITLLFLCFFCAIGSAIWLGNYSDRTNVLFIPYENTTEFNPYFQGFIVFFTYIIIFQAVIPLPLYVSLELVKLFQVYFINSDLDLYDEASDKRVECRALNITEDLGQVEYVFSDKTGTLTENVMEFKSCTIGGRNYPHAPDPEDEQLGDNVSRFSFASRNSSIVDNLKLETELQRELSSMCLRSIGSVDLSLPVQSHSKQVQEFFLLMAICNTVVTSTHAHEDPMDAEGEIHNSIYISQNMDPPENAQSRRSRITDTPKKNLLENSRKPSVENALGSKKGLLPPLSNSLGTDSAQFPLNAARLEYMLPSTKGVSTPSEGSIAGSSMISELSARIRYEAESPDELALVRAANTYGCCLRKRSADKVTCWLPGGEGEVEFDILHILQFDSTRKRMSVIVRHPLTHEIILYTKGADSAVLSVLSHRYKVEDELRRLVHKTEDHILQYAMQGLRTLCMAKRVLKKDVYEKWAALHKEAETAMEDRETKVLDSACRIEMDLDLLGATGIEDKLQEGVPETIRKLREAGMKVWVLTGDKQETAIQVAYASELFNQSQELITLNARNMEETKDLLKHHLESVILDEKALEQQPVSARSKRPEYALVIDGKTLAFTLEKEHQKLFLKLTEKCHSVICCRSSPIQKGSVVKLVRDELNKLTVAIGDGANDVSMIQTADVGIGISGQEGMQAVMASDFAIARFKFLTKLILVHGHWCYDRLARFAAFMFYKSLISTTTLFWFNLYSGFSGSTHIDSLFLSMQHVIFTSLPPIVNGVLDRGLTPYTLLSNPDAYKYGADSQVTTFMLFWFNIYSGYSGSTHVDTLYLTLEHVVFVAFPPIFNGVLDRNLPSVTLISHPDLYKGGPLGQSYTRWSFLVVLIDALFQSVIIHFTCYFGYFEGVGMWEYGTTMMVCLILVILLHLALETHSWSWPQWLSLILSFVCFWLFGIIIDSIFFTFDHPVTPYWVMQNTIAKPIHTIIVVLACVTALVPRIVVRTIQHTVFPNVITRAQLKEKLDQEQVPSSEDQSRNESPDSGTETTDVNGRERGIDNPVIIATGVPEVSYKNGRIKKRQNGLSSTPETTIESAT